MNIVSSWVVSTIVRKELIRETSLRTGYTQVVCGEIIKEAFEVITAELEAHGSVQLPNFGVFDVYDKKATRVRKPDTGEVLMVEGKKYPKFIPAELLKEKVSS